MQPDPEDSQQRFTMPNQTMVMNDATTNYMQIGDITAPYTISLGTFDPFQWRQHKIEELANLVDMRAKLGSMTPNSRRIETAIDRVMDELYPDEQPEHTKAYEKYIDSLPQVTIKGEPLSDALADIASDETKYYNFHNAMDLTRNGHGRVARKAWDNTLNQEYVVGRITDIASHASTSLIKHYNNTTPDYYKKVEHTYKPTKEDQEATDWYIL